MHTYLDGLWGSAVGACCLDAVLIDTSTSIHSSGVPRRTKFYSIQYSASGGAGQRQAAMCEHVAVGYSDLNSSSSLRAADSGCQPCCCLIPRLSQGSQVSPKTITGPHNEAKAPARSALLGKASKYPEQLTSAPLREARQQKDPRVAALLCLKQVSPSIRRLLAQLTSALLCLKCVRWFLLCSALLGKTSNALHSLSDLLPQHIYIAR